MFYQFLAESIKMFIKALIFLLGAWTCLKFLQKVALFLNYQKTFYCIADQYNVLCQPDPDLPPLGKNTYWELAASKLFVTYSNFVCPWIKSTGGIVFRAARLSVSLYACMPTLTLTVTLGLYKVQCSYLLCRFQGSSTLDDINVEYLVTLTLWSWKYW